MRLSTLLLCLTAVCAGPRCFAAAVVDQQNLPGPIFYMPMGPTFAPAEPLAEGAQTFTPGMNGQLLSISVSLEIFDYDPTTSVTLAIVPVLPDGSPDTTGTPLASVTQDLPPGQGFYLFDFSSQNFNVIKGQQIAYWLTSAGFSRYHTDGFPPSPYLGGDAYYRLPGATDGRPVDWTPINIGGSDDYFQTVVNNPEPATLAIFGSGLVALALLARRR